MLASSPAVKYAPNQQLSAILLPEMAFSGYMFASRAEIEPFCELAEHHSPESPVGGDGCTCGPTVRWAFETAKRHGCAVQVGFPRLGTDGGSTAKPSLYNSLCLVEPSGRCTLYDKTHLFETDESWATEGSGFKTIDLELRKSTQRVGFAICMDLNPYKFEAPFDAYEVATHHVEKDVDLVCGSMAWCGTEETIKAELKQCLADSDDEEDDEESELEEDEDSDDIDGASNDSPDSADGSRPSNRAPRPAKPAHLPIDPSLPANHGPWPPTHMHKPSFSTINYWATRLGPLIDRPAETIAVIANRTGTERGTTFLGSSCVLRLGKGRAELLGVLGRGEQKVLVVDV